MDSRTIYVSWDPPVLDERNGVIRENRITVTELDTGATFLEFSSVTTATVTSLHPFYAYALTVSSFTVSYGPTSDAVNVTLPPDGKDCVFPAGFSQLVCFKEAPLVVDTQSYKNNCNCICNTVHVKQSNHRYK